MEVSVRKSSVSREVLAVGALDCYAGLPSVAAATNLLCFPGWLPSPTRPTVRNGVLIWGTCLYSTVALHSAV